jgi:hypothetical protein
MVEANRQTSQIFDDDSLDSLSSLITTRQYPIPTRQSPDSNPSSDTSLQPSNDSVNHFIDLRSFEISYSLFHHSATDSCFAASPFSLPASVAIYFTRNSTCPFAPAAKMAIGPPVFKRSFSLTSARFSSPFFFSFFLIRHRYTSTFASNFRTGRCNGGIGA